MILEEKKVKIDSNINLSTMDMSVDLSKINKIISMFSNLYSNKLSWIREWLSNAWDSHKSANKEATPIVFRMLDTECYVEDWGLGIGPDKMKNIVSKVGASDKDDNPDVIGAYGVGLYSGFAFKSDFILHDFYDGLETIYQFANTDQGFKILELLSRNTDRENGCIFIISYNEFERHKILSELKTTLYFDNLIYEGQFIEHFNDYKTFRYKNFVVSFTNSGLIVESKMFAIINQVYYKLDWDWLGMSYIPCGIGIYIESNKNVVPTLTREAFDQTDKAKAQIIASIDCVKKEIQDLYLKQRPKTLPFNELLDYRHDLLAVSDSFSSYIINVKSIISALNCSPIKLKGFEQFKYRNVNDLKKLVTSAIEVRYESNHTYRGYRFSKSYSNLNFNVTKFLSRKGKFTPSKNSQISNKVTTNVQLCVSIARRIKLWGRFSYYTLLSLKDVDRSEWRDLIISYQKWLDDYIIENFYDYDAITPPKKEKVPVNRDGIVGRIYRSNGSREIIYKIIPKFLINKKKTLVFYSSDDAKLNLYYHFIYYYGIIIHVSKKNEKFMKEELNYQNLIHIDDDEKMRKILGKGIMSLLFHRFRIEYSNIFNENLGIIAILNLQFRNDLDFIKAYKSVPDHINKETLILVELLIKEYIDKKFYDHEAYSVYERCSDLVSAYKQLEYVNTWKDGAENIAEKILRYDQLKQGKRLLSYQFMNRNKK